MDPNVQVAFVGVFATLITTIGVVSVAFMNNLKQQVKTADIAVKVADAAVVASGLDEGDVLKKMLALIDEQEQKSRALIESHRLNLALQAEVRQLKAELTLLRLQEPDL